jgi:glycosyltransferase involved in cell wall biosynthesis
MARPLFLVAGRDPEDEVGGGHGAYVTAHARAVHRLGFEARLLAVSERPGNRPRDYGVVHCLRRRGVPIRQMYAPWLAPRLAADLVRRARSVPDPVLVHAFGVWGAAAVLAARALRARGRRVRVTLGSYTTYEEECRSKLLGWTRDQGRGLRIALQVETVWIRAVVNRYERMAYEGADRVLVNYDSVAAMVARSYPRVRPEKVPYASPLAFRDLADPEPEAPGPAPGLRVPPGEAPLILAVSRHDPRKGLDVLIRALSRLASKGVAFRASLVGGGPLVLRSRALAERRGLGRRVTVPGMVPDVAPYLRAATVFVLPSRNEQSGSLAVLEAMQAGLPLVATACDGLPEDLTDGDDALLVPPGSDEALARALERLLADASLRARLGRGARRTFEARFSADALVRTMAGVYGGAGPLPRGLS